ncbi:MAG: dihydrolipoamide acetyltransferase family protein [Acidimicrobiia bacterium]
MDVTMPQLGETVTEGTITRWLKNVGDAVAVDEPLFEVSTDKVDSEVPAPSAGVLSEIRVAEGEVAAVGDVLAVIGGEGAAAAAAVAATADASLAPGQPSGLESSAPEASTFAAAPAPSTPAPAPVPVAPAPAPAPPAAPAPSTAAGALVSPLVRRLIDEHGLDATQIPGTGEGARITRNDVLAFARATGATATPSAPAAAPAPVAAPAPAVAAPAAAAPAPARAAAPTLPPGQGDVVIPFDNIRRRTAEHTVRSKGTSAHVYTSVEVDFERVERVRRGAQADWKAREGFSLTYLPFVARAFCTVLPEFPNINASVDSESLVVHRSVHLAIAVDLDFNGLIAPVIKDADGKRMRLISREIRDLATRARSRALTPDEVMGGTFTITNPGPYGTYITLPIINQPQVAILSTDGIHKKPVVVEGPDGEDSIAIHHVGVLALTWDHRAFDGAYAAAFLNRMREVLETHDWESELT